MQIHTLLGPYLTKEVDFSPPLSGPPCSSITDFPRSRRLLLRNLLSCLCWATESWQWNTTGCRRRLKHYRTCWEPQGQPPQVGPLFLWWWLLFMTNGHSRVLAWTIQLQELLLLLQVLRGAAPHRKLRQELLFKLLPSPPPLLLNKFGEPFPASWGMHSAVTRAPFTTGSLFKTNDSLDSNVNPSCFLCWWSWRSGNAFSLWRKWHFFQIYLRQWWHLIFGTSWLAL